MRTPPSRPRVLKPPPSALKPPPMSVPKPPPAGAPPRPRRPRLVWDPSGGHLGDLFRIFPDLPWPRRPNARMSLRTLAAQLGVARRSPGARRLVRRIVRRSGK